MSKKNGHYTHALAPIKWKTRDAINDILNDAQDGRFKRQFITYASIVKELKQTYNISTTTKNISENYRDEAKEIIELWDDYEQALLKSDDKSAVRVWEANKRLVNDAKVMNLTISLNIANEKIKELEQTIAQLQAQQSANEISFEIDDEVMERISDEDWGSDEDTN